MGLSNTCYKILLGTGRGKEGKRDGRGSHNWGNPTDIENRVDVNNVEESTEKYTDNEIIVPEVVKNEVSLDEHEKRREAMRQAEEFAEKQLRIPETVHSGVQVLKKPSSDDQIFLALGAKKEKKRRPIQTKKQLLDMNFNIRASDANGNSNEGKPFNRHHNSRSAQKMNRPPRQHRDNKDKNANGDSSTDMPRRNLYWNKSSNENIKNQTKKNGMDATDISAFPTLS